MSSVQFSVVLNGLLYILSDSAVQYGHFALI